MSIPILSAFAQRFCKKKANIVPNYQLFASSTSDKTEKATPKKKQDARKKGQVFQSREISAAIILVIMIVTLKAFGPTLYDQILLYMKKTFTEYMSVKDAFTVKIVTKLFLDFVLVLAKTTLPLLLIAMISGMAAGYLQVGVLFTLETLKPQFSRINPLSGIKRMFSLHAVVELLKSIIKILIVGLVAYSYLKSQTSEIISLMDKSLLEILGFIGAATFSVALRICIALILLGVFDFVYQWYEYEKNLKMTKQEIKDEYKLMEGNPEIKSKIKQKQRQMSMKRMMQEVPTADVVITNPTHFAVAIKYDAAKASAPVVVAKGQDYIALKIKQAAYDNNVEVVENKPLARALYSTVNIGEAIPPELYQTVAEILAFVYNIKNGKNTK